MASLHTQLTIDNSVNTTGNSLTTIISYTLEENSVTIANVRIAGKKASNGHAIGIYFQTVLRRGSGDNSSVIVSGPIEILTPVKELDLLLCTFDAHIVNDNIQFEVKGLSSTSIDWYAVVDMIID